MDDVEKGMSSTYRDSNSGPSVLQPEAGKNKKIIN
jgi:hypothetical protein